jgi:hypothetical protein
MTPYKLVTSSTNEIVASMLWIKDRDASVGIATSYGMDGPVTEPGGGKISRNRSDRPWGPAQSPVQGVPLYLRR